MKKYRIGKIISLLLAAVLLTGCQAVPEQSGKKQYQATFLNLFDTVTSIVGYAETEEEFSKVTEMIHDELETYHQLFDIYHDYEGIHNLKTINDQAGIAPVKADQKLIDLLKDCRSYYELTDGKVNVAMGSVLSLWHEAREAGIADPEYAVLPQEDALKEAAAHCSFDTIIIDEENSTIYIEDPEQKLDVGAIAKGWAAQAVCKNTPSGYLVSVGGNVCATGPKPEGAGSWVIGVQSPDGASGEYVHTLYIQRECVVTSGDYQRYYVVDGKEYHHIIDPDTLYPGSRWSAVSIVCEDSGLADALSTALFLMSYEEGQELLERCGAYGMWITVDNEIYYSDGFEDFIRT